jgi:N-acyl-D-aspartate/D-glutamate deacylase
MTELDLVIRGGTVVDGTGAAPRTADVAMRDGAIVAVGRLDADSAATRTIDAHGLLVTPGWVDIHTHYDGQATWDSRLAPSSWHGVTTVVMGNCGVGFAPVHTRDHQALVELMEGVEDIPGTALHEGLSWEWSSFAEYLDAIESRPHDVDVAAQVPHGAVRLYVMGERGAAGEPATADDIEAMGHIAREAIAAGALGFTTSRTKNHRTSTGAYTPTLRAEAAELIGIAAEIGRGGAGVLQLVSDFESPSAETAMIHDMMAASGRPLSMSLAQHPRGADVWRDMLTMIEQMHADGLEMRAQVAVRPIGVLLGLQATINPLAGSATYRERAAGARDLAHLASVLAEPAVRERVLGELGARPRGLEFDQMYLLGARPDYEPARDTSIAARAARAGADPMEMLYAELLRDQGRALIYVPFLNYANGNLDHVAEMLQHPWCVPGLSDGGAHVGTICDASFPTTLLQHWGRDRAAGTLPIELLVAQQCRRTAETVGLFDRGVLTAGRRADVNIIDMDALAVEAPTMAFDLPAGGKRLLQRARGYRHTFVHGVETYVDGEPTDELPGRLVRGATAAR